MLNNKERCNDQNWRYYFGIKYRYSILKKINKEIVELFHDGSVVYYFNINTKQIEIKRFDNKKFEIESILNIKKYATYSLIISIIMIMTNRIYSSIASLFLNLIVAVMFLIIATIIYPKIKEKMDLRSTFISSIDSEQVSLSADELALLVNSADDLLKIFSLIIVICICSTIILTVLFFKFSILICFPGAILAVILIKIFLKDLEYFNRKKTLKIFKKMMY